MIKKLIAYTDFDGNPRNEAFYFHLSKLELTELEVSVKGGLDKRIKELTEAEDNGTILKIFKDVVLMSVGVKSPDGRRFIKNNEIRDDFAQTDALSTLIEELSTNADAAAAFINGIVPQM